jgi:hypothetical protein
MHYENNFTKVFAVTTSSTEIKRQLTRGHKQCWHFTRGIIPQLGKATCTKMPFRSASRTAHTAKRWQ